MLEIYRQITYRQIWCIANWLRGRALGLDYSAFDCLVENAVEELYACKQRAKSVYVRH